MSKAPDLPGHGMKEIPWDDDSFYCACGSAVSIYDTEKVHGKRLCHDCAADYGDYLHDQAKDRELECLMDEKED